MKRLALLTAGACTVSVAAWADDMSASIGNQSPSQAAMSEAITQLLTSQLGETALWTRLTGRAKQFNQSLYVEVPEHAITLGRAEFDANVRFQVASDTKWVENCNGTQDFTQTVETTIEAVNSYYDTQARNAQSTQSHTVTLDAKVGTGLGSYVETSYSFNHTQSSSENASTRHDQSDDRMVKETITLTAAPGESVAFQTNQVVLAGSNATFTAHASVKTAVTLDFYVKTVGTLTPDVGISGAYVTALDNSPKPGQILAAGDLHAAGQVLRSLDGGFIFGVETGRGTNQRYGAWSVVDLNASQPANPARLWQPVATSTCTMPLDLVMTAQGELQLRCGTRAVWQTNNSVKTGNPCFYLTFVPEAPGELACYSTRPGAGGQITYLNGVVATRTMGDEIRPGLLHVKKSLSQLLSNAGVTQEVSFTGTFDGAIGVLGPIHCAVTYAAKPSANGSSCDYTGLANTSKSPGGKGAKRRTPSGETVNLSYCGPTNAFLQPYLARNPMSVADQ